MIRNVFTLLVCFTIVLAAAPTIGTITSNGRFQMNGAETWNQSALLDGAAIETGVSASRLLLRNGTDLRIAAASHSRVFADRMILESGAVEGIFANTFRLETPSLGLKVQGDNARAHIQVNQGKVVVASLQGAVRVRAASGLLVASVAEGSAVQLSGTGQGATASVQLTGLVEHTKDGYMLRDTASNVLVQLKGTDVAKYVGKQVTVSGQVDPGKPTVPSAEYAVNVVDMKAAVGANTGAVTATGGVGTATKIGIIGGVAVAGAATTGLVIAGSDEQPGTVSP